MHRSWWFRALAYAALVAAIAAVGVFSVRHEMDLPIYYDSATRAVHADPDLYGIASLNEGLHFRYAPVLALLFAPLTLLPIPVAGVVWYLLKIAALALTVRIAVKLAGSPETPALTVFGIAFLLAGAYVVEELGTGNMHLLAVSCLIVACCGVERGRVAAPALLFALAILAKVTPAIALPYLAVRRQWRVLIATVGMLVALALAPSLIVGPATNMMWLRDWSRTALARAQVGPQEHDESLKGALTHYFAAPDAPIGKFPSVRITTLPESVIWSVWIAACALMLGLLLLTASDRFKDTGRRVFEYPLLVVTMLLVSPHNTRIYYCALFFPYLMLAIAALRRVDGPTSRWLRPALWLAFVTNTVMPLAINWRAGALAYQAAAPFVWSSLIAFALLYGLTRTPRTIELD